MIKILASGDNHWDEHSRFAECKRVHGWIADTVAERRPAVFLDGGDIYERASTPIERAAVAEWVKAITETCPMVIVKGNHDRPFDCEFLGRLRTKHPVIVEERCGVHYVGGVAIAALAWPSRSMLLAKLGRGASSEAVELAAGDALRDVLRGLGTELAAHDGPKVLLTHAMINGSRTSLGQPLVGCEMTVGLDDLALSGADFVVASHIHCPQEWEHGDTQILYCGSPYRTAFGETEPKSIVELTLGEGTALWDRIETPATQMLLLEGAWDSALGAMTMDPQLFASTLTVRGAEVRFRYEVEHDHREASKRAAQDLRDKMLADGAVSVKLDEQVIALTRARAPEITTARTLSEKVQTLWSVHNDTPDAERRERLLAKLAQLESEVA